MNNKPGQIDAVENREAAAAEEFLTYEQILEEYRRRQMIEHLTGPVISLVLHIVVIALFAFFLAGREIVATTTEIEFEVRDLEVEPFDEELLDRLDRELETELVHEAVPTIQPPDIQADAMEAEAVDDFADDMAAVDLDFDFATEISVRDTRSPIVLPGVMASRGEGEREAALRRHAGPMARRIEATVIKALDWLKNNQNADGSWPGPGPGRAAMTGLGVLTFLAHNETPANSDEYGETVQRAIRYLVNQVLENGYNPGTPHGGAYTNGIVAYALSEAYAMTRMPVIKPAMEEALRRIVDGQQDNGGFDYGYRKGDRWDLSVSGWQFQALKAGYLAGAEVEGLAEAIEKGVSFLKNVTFHSQRGFGYSSPGGNRPAVHGAGVLALQLFGEGRSREVQRGLELIDEYRQNRNLEWSQATDRLAYEAYYQVQAMFHAGTRYFRPWHNVLAPTLVDNQRTDGSWGSPDPEAGGWQGSDVMTTTLNAMSLMVYYRFLPTFQDPETREETVDIFRLGEDELSLQ